MNTINIFWTTEPEVHSSMIENYRYQHYSEEIIELETFEIIQTFLGKDVRWLLIYFNRFR